MAEIVGCVLRTIRLLVVVLIGGFAIAVSIRRAKDVQGEGRLRLEKKAEYYDIRYSLK